MTWLQGSGKRVSFPGGQVCVLLLQDLVVVGSQESSAVKEVSLPSQIKRRVS